MDWQPVESSNIHSIAYNAGKLELHIKFKSGAEYAFQGVAPKVASELMAAPSKGKFFAQNIRGKYEYRRKGE